MLDFTFVNCDSATKRWEEREEKRTSDEEKLKNHKLAEVESPERIAKNLERMNAALVQQGESYAKAMASPPATAAIPISGGAAAAPALAPTPEVSAPAISMIEDISRERIIGRSDLMGIEFLERGIAVGRFVGRVNIRNAGGVTVGFGTGFMVSPRLMLTNNHVLETSQDAANSLIEFDYQLDRRGVQKPIIPFRLRPDVFYATDKNLDYSLVAVSEASLDDVPISHFAWSRLIEDDGKILISQPVNIIQHPRGEFKQLVLRENHLIDLLPNFAHYTADTEPGSSGAPVYSDLWEIVALHHAGVPDRDAQGNVLTTTGAIFTNGMDPKLIRWKANEGVRISVLVRDIKAKFNGFNNAQKALVRELLDKDAPNPLEVKEQADSYKPGKTVVSVPAPISERPPMPQGTSAQPVQQISGQQIAGEVTWTIPLQVKIGFGAPQIELNGTSQAAAPAPAARAAPQAAALAPATGPDTEEAISIDPNYEDRPGYQTGFLGNGNKEIVLPELTDDMKSIAARSSMGTDDNPFELKYHHYSVVMNGQRRLAFFTAVNIDGSLSQKPRREKDKWFFDPRISRDEQCGNDLYAGNALDRGHLVRRLDPAWGQDSQIAKVANDDTFHFTNCSPQHQDFNQSKALWAGLEDYVLNNADNRDLKVSVFTGPVFGEDDPEYRDVQLPKRFWKVVAMVKQNGKLSATAYIVSQQELIDNLEAEFVFGKYKTFQVSIETIEQLSGLDFGKLRSAQPAGARNLEFNESVVTNELTDYSQIRL